jgi:hypothetical protein
MNSQMAPLSAPERVELQNDSPQRLSFGVLDSAGILAELTDVPDEAIAYALASSVYGTFSDHRQVTRCLDEADRIRVNLRALGFDIIAITQ